jgi:hypothetical protein
MSRFLVRTGIFVAGILLLASGGQAQAGRALLLRTPETRSSGMRADITVPYLTTGRSPFMTVRVEPYIYFSPIMDDPRNPQSKPVFNLIFYGASQAFGSEQNGATPKPR